MNKQIKAIIRLRRDNETNFNKIKDSFIPANGEIVLVDTLEGLRAKVGTGTTKYGLLPYCDEVSRNGVVNGYLDNGIFYTDISKTSIINGSSGKIYIDNAHSKIYYYEDNQFKNIQTTFTTATSEVAGVVKLYSSVGDNTDGTMTQKAITEELNSRYKTSVQANEELLIFSL